LPTSTKIIFQPAVWQKSNLISNLLTCVVCFSAVNDAECNFTAEIWFCEIVSEFIKFLWAFFRFRPL
jgi:hypothetical protein